MGGRANMEQLLKPSDVARIIRVSRSTAYELIATGQLSTVRIGKNVRVPAIALERWIREHAVREKEAAEHDATYAGDLGTDRRR
jgi:excisionase family DNA binding protein